MTDELRCLEVLATGTKWMFEIALEMFVVRRRRRI